MCRPGKRSRARSRPRPRRHTTNAPAPKAGPAIHHTGTNTSSNRCINTGTNINAKCGSLHPEVMSEAADWMDRQRALWGRYFDVVDEYLKEKGSK